MEGEYMATKGFVKRDANAWKPPLDVSREECIKASQTVLATHDMKVKQNEDIFRIRVLEMDWDMGVMVYEPEDASKIPTGPDGKKVGIFLLHGGSADYKSMEKLALLFAGKFGYKVVSMTYPGRLYLDDPSRDWPGDTINPDGTVRTPIWKKGERITPDQYEVVKDVSMRMRYGARTVARAKPGTTFYYRMAAWPVAFEEAMKDANRRHLPEDEYSIYVHGHSTGGPIVSMLSQRVPNIAGVIGIENSTFGYIEEKKHAWSGSLGKVAGYDRVSKKEDPRADPFNELYIRSWRDLARYRGPEALGQEGPNALMRLPWLIEEVLGGWEKVKLRPQFKAEYIITHNIVSSLTEAAQVTAKRLNLDPKETEALVKRYLGYTRELTGPGVKPVPPFLFGISKDSRDHSPEAYREVTIPMFAAMNPAPKVRIVQFGAGVHTYTKPEKDLPMGIAPAVTKFYHDAIMGGYFLK
jgi:hypothetical protein